MPSNQKVHHQPRIAFNGSPEIPWTLNTVNNSFSVDLDDIKKEMGISLSESVSLENEFLLLLESSERNKLFDYTRHLLQDKKPESIKLYINKYNVLSYWLVSAKKLSSTLVAGFIKPIFIFPNANDLIGYIQQLFDSTHYGILITDSDTNIILCNRCLEQSTLYEVGDLIGQKTNIFRANKHGRTFYKEMWQEIKASGSWSGKILTKRKDGVTIPQQLTIQKMSTNDNKVYYFGITNDLSSSLDVIDGTERGGIDLLTQLPSDTFYKNKIDIAVKVLPKHYGLMVISFSPHFDEETRIESRRCIGSAVNRVQGQVIGGFLKNEVFSIAIPYIKNSSESHSLAIFKAIRHIFEQIKSELSKEIYDVISNTTIGVSVLGLDANTSTSLVSHSLQAMYEKHVTTNHRICFFNQTLHDKAKSRIQLEQTVSEAIKEKRVEVYFQPIVCTKSWKVIKYETLCRLKASDGNLLNTQEAILVAEDLNLISELDLIVAKLAIESRQQLCDLHGQSVEICINLSINGGQPIKSVFKNLAKTLKQYPQELPFITIELTESAYFNSESSDSELLCYLRKSGLKIAIDDFGTGYSSFSYLRNSNFDILKIDREFIKAITFGSNNYYIVKMITELSHTLGVEVVAEGVEKEDEIKILQSLNVDLLQGYYFDQPKPIDRINVDDFESLGSNFKKNLNPVHRSCELTYQPATIDPEDHLETIKEIFHNTNFNVLPVLNEKRCVGYIDREIFNLHCPISLGTDKETTRDLHSLNKPANMMMKTKFVKLNQAFSDSEIREKIRDGHHFPWIVVDDDGKYVSLIDSNSVIHYLNEGGMSG